MPAAASVVFSFIQAGLLEAAALEHRAWDCWALPAQVVGDLLLLCQHVLDLFPLEQLRVHHLVHDLRHALATEHPEAHQLVRRILADDKRDTEGVLAHVLHALEPAAHKVGRHELLLVILVVLVARPEARVARRVVVLEEVRCRHRAGVGVAVLALVGVQHEAARRQRVKRVRFLLLLRRLLFVVLHCLLRLLLRLGFRLRGLLRRLHRAERRAPLLQHLHRLGLLQHRVVQAVRVAVLLRQLLAVLRVHAVHPLQRKGNGDVGHGHALTDEEGAGLQPQLQARKALLQGRHGALRGRNAGEGLHQVRHVMRIQLAGGEVEPHVDLAALEGRGAVQLCAALLHAGNVAHDGVGLEEVALLRLQGGEAHARAAVARIFGRLVFLAVLAHLELDVDVGVRGGHHDLLGAGALGVEGGEELVGHPWR
ncbi:elongation factor-1 gamma [Leishmania tarentolae]|uniref:Elongation factor-1 gamma n=1 Tax=Leishmania tarentolae TaxID=5689 RepID=A0A640K9V4_LEITA|nr:elongation factor-1 gamma [Leishmania tarentolae]